MTIKRYINANAMTIKRYINVERRQGSAVKSRGSERKCEGRGRKI